MVTIEQKLTVFSKLLNQDIKEEMDEKFDNFVKWMIFGTNQKEMLKTK